jgi:hypothetical protein
MDDQIETSRSDHRQRMLLQPGQRLDAVKGAPRLRFGRHHAPVDLLQAGISGRDVDLWLQGTEGVLCFRSLQAEDGQDLKRLYLLETNAEPVRRASVHQGGLNRRLDVKG